MKKTLLSLLILVAFSMNSYSQVTTPKPSPKAKLTQAVGLTDIAIEYARPSIKGRTVFGNLVPFGKIWRTGANKNTEISFSTDVVINGKTLKKGAYAIFTKPNTTSWDVYFYTDTKNWGVPKKWDDSKVALQTTAKVEKMPMKVETFTISIDNLTNKSAILGMLWENSYVGVKIETPTNTMVEESITKTMNGPTAGDYFNAAVYYLAENKNINKAKKWIDKAVEMTNDKPKFWYFHQQALIYKKAGDKNGAKKAAERSLKLAQKAKYDAYIKKNEDFLKNL